jgi:hypothetical protein
MADYKANYHAVLETLKKDLAKGFLEDEVTVRGFKFKLHTLNEDEETWADSYIRSTTPVALLNSRKAPRLAASISAINGVPVTELFTYPDDMPKEVRQGLDDNPIQRRFWIREQMLYFLAEDAMRPFINELYEHLSKLEAKRDEAIKEVPNS